MSTVTTIWLQMFSLPERTVPAPRGDLDVIHARHPTIGYYRYLYDAVGEDYNWRSRRRMSDAKLAGIIHDPRDEVHVLFVAGVPAGFAELDRRTGDEIEITQFGLMPEFLGQGLGRWFLRWTVERAWSYSPSRLWLHTCTNDHPVALSNYQKAGFMIDRTETREEEPASSASSAASPPRPWLQKQITLAPRPRGFHLVTDEVLRELPELARVKTGVLHLFLLHTSASLAISENADPDVPRDLESSFNAIAPEDFPYVHTVEGPDDMPAHVKNAMLGCSLTIPVSNGAPVLGTWQGIFLCEHRNHGGRRRLVLTLHGDWA